MGESSPREAAYQLLRRQSGHRPASPSGLIDLDTVDCVVEQKAPGRCVLGATMKDMAGADFCLLFFAAEESDGSWRARNARMSSIDESSPSIAFVFEFGASPMTIDFVGMVTGAAAARAASIRLTFSDGGTITQPVDGGWVAFAKDGDTAAPVVIELADAAGRVLLTDSYTERYRGTSAGQTR